MDTDHVPTLLQEVDCIFVSDSVYVDIIIACSDLAYMHDQTKIA